MNIKCNFLRSNAIESNAWLSLSEYTGLYVASILGAVIKDYCQLIQR